LRHDVATARTEAELAAEADPTLPVPDLVEARLLHDEGKYDEALPVFQQAIAQTAKFRKAPLADLHFYAADSLVRVDRASEAEAEYLEELRYFPQNTRARAGLATLYHTLDRDDDAAQALSDLVRVSPTRESFATAARLWTTFGRPREAAAVRAQAQRALSGSSARFGQR
jgi:tetratricopeptide (TPR) repeat protein